MSSMSKRERTDPMSPKDATAPPPGDVFKEFRSALLESFNTLREAYDAFHRDVPPGRDLSKPDWRHLLHKHGLTQFAGRRAVDEIFKTLDFTGDGFVSLKE